MNTTNPDEPKTLTLVHTTILALIVLAGYAIRVYRVGEVPAGLFCDEAAYGYNAFTIANFGVSEDGISFPLFFYSFTGYKDPGYIYSAALLVKLFGLSEFSVRLTSVLYGTAGLIAVFFLARELWGAWAGLWAALILAVTPWHFHFSRVSFSLIGYPFTFMMGLWFLFRATRRGGWNWICAGLFLGLTLYFYAIALLFIPLILAFFVPLFFREIRRDLRWAGGGLLALGLLFGRILIFKLTDKRDSGYFLSTTWIFGPQSLEDKLRLFYVNYSSYFTNDFLYLNGDHVIRHHARGFGEVLPILMPVYAIGAILLLMPLRRKNLLILIWLLLYPVGAVIMNENPSATRAFIGSPLAALIAAHALGRAGGLIGTLRFVLVRNTVNLALAASVIFFIYQDAERYLELYFGKYYRDSSRGIRGFQYGYKEMLTYLKEHMHEYEQVLQTAENVNMPYIFQNFYFQTDPIQWIKDYKRMYFPEYFPYNFEQYRSDVPVLFALREEDLGLYSDYDIKKKIVAPDGVTEFVIVEIRKRHEFLTRWKTVGLVRSSHDFGSPDPLPAGEGLQIESLTGPATWKNLPENVNVDLNDFYRRSDPRHFDNPENCCAETKTFVEVQSPQDVQVILFGSDDGVAVWINGEAALPVRMLPYRELVEGRGSLEAGWNEISVRTCEGGGEWFFRLRLARMDGSDIPDLQQRFDPPDTESDRLRAPKR